MTELADFSNEISRILSDPWSVSIREGFLFANRLSDYLLQTAVTAPLWSGKDSNDASVSADNLSPQAKFMRLFENILVLRLEEMRCSLLDALHPSCQELQMSLPDSGLQCWQVLREKFLLPMDRLSAFSKVMRACTSPMSQWLSDSVLLGHRSLCLVDLVRQLCLDHFLKHAASNITVAIFNALHGGSRNWETIDLQPVHQFVSLVHVYQRFQAYLTSAGHRNGSFDRWEVNSREASGDSDQFTVDSVIVQPYLACLKQFYEPLLDPFDSSLVARSVSDWLMTEELLSVHFSIQDFRDSVVNCVLQATVKNHLAALGDTVLQLLVDGDSQGLSLFFSVLVMVDGGQDHLLEVIRRFVTDRMVQVFDGIKSDFKMLDPNSSKATSIYVEACVSQLRHCKAIVEATIELQQTPSLSRSLLLGTVRAGIADVLNSASGSPLAEVVRHQPVSGYPAAALAHHFHRQMRSIRTMDAATEESLNDLVTLYSLLEDKESFMLRYHALLRERLLSESCEQLSLEAECFVLESFTQLSGWKALYEVKSVLKDYRESESFLSELREQARYCGLMRQLLGERCPSPGPVRFVFVRGYFWRIAAETVRLPGQLASLANAAVEAYQSRHSGRSVSLAYSYGSGLLAFSPRRRRPTQSPSQSEAIQLRCSAAVMIILLHCDEASSLLDPGAAAALTEPELQRRTGIKPADLAFYLRHLARAGVLVDVTGGDAEVDADNEDNNENDGGVGQGRRSRRYALNDEFDSDAKQVNLMILQQQQAQKQRRRLEKLDQRMKEKKVQCAIVSTMKQERQLSRKDLFQLVQARLPQLRLQTGFFADQLTYLVSGGYVKYASTEDTPTETVEAATMQDNCVIEYIP